MATSLLSDGGDVVTRKRGKISMLPKFSIVSIGVHDDVLNWVAKYKPVSIIVVNERGQSRPEKPWESNEIDSIRNAMSASPKTLWIMRSWPDGIGEGTDLGDRLIECFQPFRDMPNPLMGHSYNEPGFPYINAVDGVLDLYRKEAVLAWDLHEANLLMAGLCFSESHLLQGNMHLWEHLTTALQNIDAWCPNEYDWPWVFTSRDQGYKWRIGHWEHQIGRLRKILGDNCAIPPVIIGEGILDGKIWTNTLPEGDPMRGKPHGWQKRWSPIKYIAQHLSAHNDTYHKPEVFAHHTFCYCHPSSEWRSYSVKPLLTELGNLVNSQVYWSNDQGGGSMGVWKDVPENIAQWRPLIEKVTSSYHVPIPPVNDIHVSPAKVLAVMIQRESEGNTGATNVETGAAGLMQIMPFHFEEGQDPYEPEWNVRKGLSILEGKLYPKKAPPRDFQTALFYYSGRHTRPFGDFINEYWNPFIAWYKQFWGTDLEPKSNDRIKEALARIGSKLDGIDYLVKQIREEKELIEEKLL